MPFYRVDRTLAGLTSEDLEAAAFRALSCQRRHEGIRWIRSIVNADSQRGTCVYEAPNAEILEVHQREADLVWDSITEIVEIMPEQFVDA